MAEAKTSGLKDRPLSPHLQIYKPMLTMMMSIVHRITGGALFFGMLLLVWWLTAAAAGPNAYATLQWFMETLLGRLILFGYTWALIHHMLGGIKHLIWDLGYGFGPTEREWLTVATLVGSVGFTILLWLVGYLLMGGRPMTDHTPHSMRTPFGRVRHLGSARSGTSHFWRQRLTSVANVPLTIAVVVIIMSLLGRNHAAVVQILGSSLVAITLLLFVMTSVYHMWLGMQVIVEDYVHDETLKIVTLMGNTFFSFAVGAAAVFAILKLAFGL